MEGVSLLTSETMVAVVGGGPAGAAAAITCARRGIPVALIERCPFPRHRPGESLHPGLEPLFRQLGVLKEVEAVAGVRHRGHYVYREGVAQFIPFGSDARRIWRGYQILREDLDAILLRRAARLGATIFQPCAAQGILWEGERVAGVRLSTGDLRASWVIDAGGAQSRLQKGLGGKPVRHSPRWFARYGYATGISHHHPDDPVLTLDHHGWVWTAKIGEQLYQWTRFAFEEGSDLAEPPAVFRSLQAGARVRRADITWRCAPSFARPGLISVGDAAVVMDPASSHGVLRAIMSGIMAGHSICRMLKGGLDESSAIQSYATWIGEWFRADVDRLHEIYRSTSSAV